MIYHVKTSEAAELEMKEIADYISKIKMYSNLRAITLSSPLCSYQVQISSPL